MSGANDRYEVDSVTSNQKLVTNIKGHHRITKNVDGVKTNIDVFTTKYVPGSNIRCAITGTVYQNHFVGSKDERTFFKVCLSGVFNEKSYGKHLYFHSPYEYEEHFHTTVSDCIKEKWKNTYDELMSNSLMDDNGVNV